MASPGNVRIDRARRFKSCPRYQMHDMKIAEIALAILAFVTGLVAAGYWYRASKITADPGWGRNGLVEPGVHSAAQDAWIAAMLQSASESARLNKIAALWTAAAVALNALAALIAFLA